MDLQRTSGQAYGNNVGNAYSSEANSGKLEVEKSDLEVKTQEVSKEPLTNIGKINFAGDKFADAVEKGKVISQDRFPHFIRKGVLQSKEVPINCYSGGTIRGAFTFKENGFVFLKADNDFKLEAQSYDQGDPMDFRQKSGIAEATKEMLLKFKNLAGIEAEHLVILPAPILRGIGEGVYENKPISLLHIDFDEDQKDYLEVHGEIWLPAIEQACGEACDSYDKIDSVKMVNIWMPLNSEPNENILAMTDISTTAKTERVFKTMAYERVFHSKTLAPDINQKFIIQSDMKLGDVVIFDTLKTPHTAVDVERDGATKDKRQSIEIRAMFFNLKSK
ncbi:MAG: hypothetical protein ACXWM7_06850 [Parachlamydiaceae bacterium]